MSGHGYYESLTDAGIATAAGIGLYFVLIFGDVEFFWATIAAISCSIPTQNWLRARRRTARFEATVKELLQQRNRHDSNN